MKKLFLLLTFTLFVVQIHPMESGLLETSSTKPPIVIGSEDLTPVIIKTHDDQVLCVPKYIICQSNTIKSMLDDFGSEEGIHIPLGNVSAYDFKTLLPYLEDIFVQQANSVLVEKLNTHSLDELIAITNNANYLEVPRLLECCISAMTQKLSSPEIIKQYVENIELPEMFPNELSNAIARKLVQESNIANIILKPIKNYIELYDHSDMEDVNSIAFSSDNSLLASASDDETVCLYDIANPTNPHLIKQLKDHTDWVHSVAFSSDNRLLASASHDKTICLYNIADPTNPRLIKQLKDHTTGISSICFSSDNQLLAAAPSHDTQPYLHPQKIYLYNISDPENPLCVEEVPISSTVPSITFSSNNRLLAFPTNSGIKLSNVIDQNKLYFSKILDTPRGTPSDVIFGSNNMLAVTVNQTIYLFDITDPKNPEILTTLYKKNYCFKYGGHKAVDVHPQAIALNSDSTLLACSAEGNVNTITLHDISDPKNPKILRQLYIHEHGSHKATEIIFSSDNKLIASTHGSCVCLFYLDTPAENFMKNLLIEHALLLAALFEKKLTEIPHHLLETYHQFPESLQNVIETILKKNMCEKAKELSVSISSPESSSPTVEEFLVEHHEVGEEPIPGEAHRTAPTELSIKKLITYGTFAIIGITAGYLIYKLIKK